MKGFEKSFICLRNPQREPAKINIKNFDLSILKERYLKANEFKPLEAS